MSNRELALTLSAECTYDPNRKKNAMHFTISDTCVQITDSDTGERLGEVAGCIGGAIEIRDKKTGETWTITPLSLWTAYQKATGNDE